MFLSDLLLFLAVRFFHNCGVKCGFFFVSSPPLVLIFSYEMFHSVSLDDLEQRPRTAGHVTE